MTNPKNKIDFIFFGTPQFAVFALEELEKEGLLPSLVVTAPDRPAGRGLALTKSPVKIWAEEHSIKISQPEKLNEEFIDKLKTDSYELAIVAAYGKIIPNEILDTPKHGTLNAHPSLLPKYRGPSPLEAQILAGDEEAGISIMLLDEEMDHGPILAQEKFELGNLNKEELGEKLFRLGGQMLANIIPNWVSGEITAHEQNHEQATYTKKIAKQDGLVDLNDDSKTNWNKFRAYYGWPGTFFFTKRYGKEIRVKITDAEFKNNEFVVKKVIPEGKKEINYDQFLTN
ncbi:methionyl-tRNA formyltransferase [Patescibacteria group bacterium]